MSIQEANGTAHTELEMHDKIGGVEPIERNRNELVWEKAQLDELVEPPLLRACQELYDKNVRTLATSANKKDVEVGYAYIIIEAESLSPENLQIAETLATDENNELGPYDGRQALVVHIPMDENTSPEEIEGESLKVAAQFKKQPLTWAPVFTLAQLKQYYGIDAKRTEYDDPTIWTDEGYYYDEESKQFYFGKEQYRKMTEPIT